jgi:hypothetical protein
MIEEYLNALGQRLSEQLIKDIQTKRVTKYGAVNASGELASSVKYTVAGSVLTITARKYIGALEFGRKNGKRPPRQVIRDWIDEKGIVPNGISKDSLAFLIQRKIGEKGTTIFQQGGSDLVSGIFNEALVDSIQKDFAQLIAAEISSDVLKIAA